MCIVLFAWQVHPHYPLVLAANRDEFRGRPTAPAAPWPDAPDVVGGRDLQEGGTWLGFARGGRWAAVTNFYEPAAPPSGARSRGHLAEGFLRGGSGPEEYLAGISRRGRTFGGFNLLVGDTASVHWLSNRSDAGPVRLSPGIYGVSNHLLDTPWPKVARGKRELERVLAGEPEPELLLGLLLEGAVATDSELPESGPGANERWALSAIFLQGPDFGTRSSTALLIDADGGAILVERTHSQPEPAWTEVRQEVGPGR